MYTPLNVQVFIAAMTGALGGLGGGGLTPTDPAPTDPGPVSVATTAALFAESFDTIWTAAAADTVEISTIQSICEAAWSKRGTPGTASTAASYNAWVSGLIAEVKAGSNWYTSNIGPPPSGGLFLGVTSPITYAAGIVGIQNATGSQSGAVTAAAQTFGGTKTFQNGMVLASLTSLTQTQGSPAGTPSTEYPLVFIPAVLTSRAPFALGFAASLFNASWDVTMQLGYNPNGNVAGEPVAGFSIESNYESAPGNFTLEHYLHADDNNGHTYRWCGAVLNRTTGALSSAVEFGGGGGNFSVVDATSGNTIARFDPSALTFANPAGYAVESDNTLLLRTSAGALNLQSVSGGIGISAIGAATNILCNTPANGAFGITAGDIQISGDTIDFSPFAGPSTGVMEFHPHGTGGVGVTFARFGSETSGLQLFSAALDLGGGTDVLGMAAGVAPTTNPAAGNIILYSNGGALAQRTPAGNVFTLIGAPTVAGAAGGGVVTPVTVATFMRVNLNGTDYTLALYAYTP